MTCTCPRLSRVLTLASAILRKHPDPSQWNPGSAEVLTVMRPIHHISQVSGIYLDVPGNIR
ncbi:hypothetical protein Stube_04500 [Streptomyces tubercidicus]|uniref:Uncharacterized protein n=1 Tax=Streptomyces tubercidicus TaxID=47759 RepID=A0A640UJ08_9ACTN|nr:hypothetical protein Stube_04500 [Streptomyces tubercidicus]